MTTVRTRTSGQQQCPLCNRLSCSGKKKQHHPVLTQSDHPMLQFWDWDTNATAGFDPSKITCRSQKRTHWICHQCPRGQPHRWQATVNAMYSSTGCPMCFGRRACKCNSLKSLRPDLANQWDYTRNEDLPEDYTVHSNHYAWWCSRDRGSYRARIADRTYVRKALSAAKPPLGMMPSHYLHTSCPLCANSPPMLFAVQDCSESFLVSTVLSLFCLPFLSLFPNVHASALPLLHLEGCDRDFICLSIHFRATTGMLHQFSVTC